LVIPLPKLIERMRKVYLLLLFILFAASSNLFAQVSVTATAGTAGPTPYPTLKDAFDAINAGTHQGAVTVGISASTSETATCVLNGSGAGPALYTSVMIRPTSDAVVVSFATATGRGVIELNGADNVTIDGDNPNTAGTNRDLTIQNLAANTVTFTSCVRLATSTLVLNCDNVTIKNCHLLGSGTGRNTNAFIAEVTTWGVIASANASTAAATTAPSALTSATTASTGTQTMTNLLISNNDIQTVARGISINGSAATVYAGLLVSNNEIGNSIVADPNQVTAVGITVNGTNNGIIRGNTVRLECYIASSTPNRGINVGMVSTTGLTNVTIDKNKVERVINNNVETWPASGIDVSGGTNHIITNNFVGDCLNSQVGGTGAFSTTFGAFGIRINAGTGHKLYHNTVNFTGAVAGSVSTDLVTALCIVTATSTGMDIRNNIFSNQATGGNPTLYNTVFPAIYLPSGATSAMNLTLNNNAYYHSASPQAGIAQVGTTGSAASLYLASNFNPSSTGPANNLRAYTSTLSAGTNDNASITDGTGTTPFVSLTDFHINLGTTPTQLESGGAAVGITTDIDGNVRPGPAGSVNGGASAPDIGADEFDGVPLDLVAPVITFTSLANTCGTGDRTLTGVTIADASGVPTAGADRPRIHYSKNGGAWSSQPGTLTSGTATNGTWSFTIVGSDMGGVFATDVISYFIVARDNAPAPNYGSNPGGADINTVSIINTPPPVPATYTIGQTLTGIYTVGSAGAYTTLTAAITAFNAACISGPVTLSLIDPDYSSGETFPLIINANSFMSAANTLTIRPAAGNAVTVSGSTTTSILKINGADYVTIDGLNTGGASLSISNTNASTAASVVWVGSLSASDGATNNAIKNVTITGNTSTTTLYGIFSGSGATLGSVAQTANSNLLVQDNTIHAVQNGLTIFGNGTTLDQGVTISGNTLGSSAATEKLGLRGINLQNSQGFAITNNTITGVSTTTTTTASGIFIGGAINGGTVSRNIIRDVKNTNTGGWGSNGLWVNSTSTGANILIANNFISDVASYGFNGSGSSDNGYGIIIGDGFTVSSGYNIYYNTVVLNTNQTSTGGLPAPLNITAGIANGGVNVVNNILVNAQTTGTQRYAIYSGAANTVFGTIDYNDYQTTGTNLGYIGSNRVDLAAVITGFGQNTHSINILPVFVAPDDLHLDAGSNASLENLALPLGTVTNDIDLQTRDAGAPDMGADELPAPACAGAVGGAINAANAFLCVSGSTNITASGFSNGVGSGYQWQSSPNNSTWSDIGGATLPGSYNTGTITTTTYYRLRVTCTSGVATNYSNVVTVAVNPNPTVTVSPAGPISICAPATQVLSVTATSAVNPSYQWLAGNADISGEVAFNYIASTSGSYSVKVTNGNTTCSVTSTPVVVTVNVQPSAVDITPPATTICPGSSAVQLTTSGGTISGAVLLSENFNGVAAGWTTVNNTTGGTTPAAAAWTLRPSGYVENFTTFTNGDGSQFFLSNSDAAGSGNNTLTILTSPAFSTVGFTTANLAFQHHYNDYDAADFAYVEVSTNGTTWTTLTTYTTDQGAIGNFATANIDLSAYVGQPTVYVRYRYVAIWGFYWLLDNVSITGDQSTNITWTPATGLFTDAAATTAYVAGTAAASVYAKPASTQTYTATATSPATCTSTGTVTVTYNTAIQPSTALAGNVGGAQVCGNYSLATSNNFFNNCNLIATVTPFGASPVSGTVNACVKIETGVPTDANGKPYVARHYDILPATNPTTATSTITLYFTQAEFNAYSAGNGGFPDLPTGSGDAAGIANLRVTQFNSTTSGGLSGYTAGSGSQINPVDASITFANNRWSVSFAATGSGGFYVHTGNFVLPVASLEFRGEQAGSINKLLWSTSRETNNRGFELERSADGKNFSSLAFVATKAENGNSTSTLNYNYNDARPLSGTNYYRLKQIDRDGRFTYSNIVVLKSKITDITLSSVYPNPATRELNLVITSPSAEKVTIIVTDLTGKVLMQRPAQLVIGDNQSQLNVQSLAAGTYLIKAVCTNGCETAVHRFVKQ
jgi:hypothetical protein